jgi:SagB-type dehydrogenase family enzyme
MAYQRLAEVIVAVSVVAAACATGADGDVTPLTGSADVPIALPSPRLDGALSLEAALATRRSIRELSGQPLSDADIGQLLWAGQGVTDADGRRTAPSAGALYPLELYVATADGVSHYLPVDHALEGVVSHDARPRLQAAALGQAPVGDAPLVIVIAAVPARTEAKYGRDRAPRYVHLEAGHVAQNVLLQAVSLGLGAVPIGAFDDAAVAEAVSLPPGSSPLYLLCIGQVGPRPSHSAGR